MTFWCGPVTRKGLGKASLSLDSTIKIKFYTILLSVLPCRYTLGLHFNVDLDHVVWYSMGRVYRSNDLQIPPHAYFLIKWSQLQFWFSSGIKESQESLK